MDGLEKELESVDLFIGPFDSYGMDRFRAENAFAQHNMGGEGMCIPGSQTLLMFWWIKLENGKKVALVEHTSGTVDFNAIDKFFEKRKIIDPKNFYSDRLPK
jgi:hypothetical protein